MNKISITAAIEKSSDGWYVGQLEEFPEVISQGRTIDELEQNLRDALSLTIEVQRNKTKEQYQGRSIIRRKIAFV